MIHDYTKYLYVFHLDLPILNILLHLCSVCAHTHILFMLLTVLQHVKIRVISYKVSIKRIILKKFNIDAITLPNIEYISKFSK